MKITSPRQLKDWINNLAKDKKVTAYTKKFKHAEGIDFKQTTMAIREIFQGIN